MNKENKSKFKELKTVLEIHNDNKMTSIFVARRVI